MDTLGIAMIGCGTVGGGVAKLLLEQRDRITHRAGRPLQLRRVVVQNKDKPRPGINPSLISTDIPAAIRDPDVHVVCELIGGTAIAKQVVLDALSAGKHVVTANKALLAEHGREIFEAARRHERVVCFEASVAGGIPIVAALLQSLSGNQITAIQGILNGTSNFILSSMSDQGNTYRDALAEAQCWATPKPTRPSMSMAPMQRTSWRFWRKLRLASRPRLKTSNVSALPNCIRWTFALLTSWDIRLNCSRKPGSIAMKWLHVAPVLLRHKDMLAQVRGAFNAIQVHGDAVGEMMFQGAGAGAMPTASSVVADLIDLAVGRAQRTFAAAKLWSPGGRGVALRPSEGVRSRYYLRVLVEDKPGMLADVARALADHQISIASVIQHEAIEEHEGQVVPLVIMTHYVPTGKFRTAVERINILNGVVPPGVYFSVDD